PDHPLRSLAQSQGHVHFSDILEHTLISLKRDVHYNQPILNLFKDAGYSPVETLCVDNIEIMKQLAIYGIGVTFLPRTVVSQDLSSGRLVELPYPHQHRLARTTYLVYANNRFIHPSVENFLGVVKSWIGSEKFPIS
ncbi:MAG: substrate-binding domain-containing protein, partial [Alicyclobacillus sp.]|nr:substrate-binding domain-containing protein [Alicyclobacillus sp.]